MDKQSFQNLVNQKGWWGAYNIYLSSSDWQTKRKKRLKIDNGKCRTCGSQERLEIHHKPAAYDKIPDENVNDDLTTLCADCHEAITSLIRQKRYSSRDIKIQNYASPREGERKLISYGMEDSEIQNNGYQPPYSTRWQFGQSVEPNRKADETNFWQAKEDRRRFRGIG